MTPAEDGSITPNFLRARPGPHTVTRDDDEDAWVHHLITKLSSHGDKTTNRPAGREAPGECEGFGRILVCWSRNPRRV